MSWLIQCTAIGHHPRLVVFFISAAFSCIIQGFCMVTIWEKTLNLSERPCYLLQKLRGNGRHASSADWRQMNAPGNCLRRKLTPIVRCNASDGNPISLPAFVKQLSRNQLSNIVSTKCPLLKCLQGKRGLVIGEPCVDLCQGKVSWCAKQHRLLQSQFHEIYNLA